MNDAAAMNVALKAINDEAEKLLGLPIDGEIREAVERIISMSRYQFDNRTSVEESNARPK